MLEVTTTLGSLARKEELGPGSWEYDAQYMRAKFSLPATPEMLG